MCWDDLFVSSDKSSSVLYSMINDFSLEQCVSTPIRGSNILDLAFTNRPDLVSSVDIVDNLPNTDHYCIELHLNILPPKQSSVQHWLYKYKKTDFNAFRKYLLSVPWGLAEADDIDVWWSQRKDLFLAAVKDSVA